MITLMAGSTNRLEYFPSVAHALPSPPVLEITDAAGNAVSVADNVVWDATNLCYVVAITPAEVPVSKISETWTIAWTWEHETDVLRDVEWAVIVSTGYEDLTPALRRRLKDVPTPKSEDFVGDGTSQTFNLTYYPVQISSQLVRVSNAIVPTSAYTFHYPSGTLTFNTAPADAATIRVVYSTFTYADYDLECHIKDALVELNALQSSSISLTNPVLTDKEKLLVIMYALRNVYNDQMLASTETTFFWRDNEKSVDKRPLIDNWKSSLGLLNERIRQAEQDIVVNNTVGTARIGGGYTISFDATDWEDINA